MIDGRLLVKTEYIIYKSDEALIERGKFSELMSTLSYSKGVMYSIICCLERFPCKPILVYDTWYFSMPHYRTVEQCNILPNLMCTISGWRFRKSLSAHHAFIVIISRYLL